MSTCPKCGSGIGCLSEEAQKKHIEECAQDKKAYRVFTFERDEGDQYFDTLAEAKAEFDHLVKEEPETSWRLYEDTESPHGSGNFTEECLGAYSPDNTEERE